MSDVTLTLDSRDDEEGCVNDATTHQSDDGSGSRADGPCRAPGAMAGETVGKLTAIVNMMTVRQ